MAANAASQVMASDIWDANEIPMTDYLPYDT